MNRIFIALLLVAVTLTCNIVPYHPVIDGKSTREYVLEFQYACRAGLGFDSCQGNVYWNDKMIMVVSPSDYEAHTKVIHVFVDVGENILKFEGAGKADGRGMILDNVKLTRLGGKRNIVKNGDFERPDVGRKWRIVNTIPGWEGKQFEIGSGHLYGKKIWNSQVIELDGRKNCYLLQRWNFDSRYKVVRTKPQPEVAIQPVPEPEVAIQPAQPLASEYTLTFDHACRKKLGFKSCQGKVFWNGKEVLEVIPSDY